MLISYNRPADITVSLLGTGSAWLSDDAGAALIDGRPANVSRLQWLSGSQTTASVLTLRASWGTGLAPRVVGLVGVTLPAGTLVKLAFRRPTDGGYDYLAGTPQQRVVDLPDGSRCCWFGLDDGLDDVIGCEFRIYNDVNGSASIAAGATVDIGEVWIGPAVDIPHQAGWQRGLTDPTVVRRSLGGQSFPAVRRAWRTLTVTLDPGNDAHVRGAALANDQDWESIEAACTGAAPCVCIPRWRDITADQLQRIALFGYADQPGAVRHQAGPWYTRNLTFQEVPAA